MDEYEVMNNEQNEQPQQNEPVFPEEPVMAAEANAQEQPAQEQPAQEPVQPQAAGDWTHDWEPADRSASTQTAEPGDWSTDWAKASQKTPRERKPRQKKQHRRGAVAAAVVAACLLVGAGSSLITTSLVNHRWENTVSSMRSDLQNQINGLKNGGSQSSGGTLSQVSSGEVMTPSQVYNQNMQSVVGITVEGVDNSGYYAQEYSGSGSGFVLTADGYVMTNCHVVSGATRITVTMYDGTEYPAALIGADSISDVAVLKVEATGLPTVTIGSSEDLSVGDMVVAIGNPLGELTLTQTVGYVSAKNRSITTDGRTTNMIQTDAAINSGNSGGPLFNMQGQVVGVTSAKYSGTTTSGASIEGIGFAIPIDDAMDIANDLMELGYVNGAALGVNVRQMDAKVAQEYNLPAGPRVESVNPGSAAEKAGVQVMDIITKLGDTEINSNSDLLNALRKFSGGDTTTITVFRGGQVVTLNITLDTATNEQGQPIEENSQQEPQISQEQAPNSNDFEDWFNFFAPFFGYGN